MQLIIIVVIWGGYGYTQKVRKLCYFCMRPAGRMLLHLKISSIAVFVISSEKIKATYTFIKLQKRS